MGYTAIKLSGCNDDLNKSGFETEELAWEYIATFRCKMCIEDALSEDPIYACDAEWMVHEDE